MNTYNHSQSKKQMGMMIQKGEVFHQKDELVHERALQIVVNGKEFSMTMQTPGDEFYLVRGLLHVEGLCFKKVLSFELQEFDHGTLAVLHVEGLDGVASKRNIVSTSSCGLCGKETMGKLFEGFDGLENTFVVSQNEIQKIYEKVIYEQPLFDRTGGCHAAAAVDPYGNVLCVFEDIGRHNAVDKVIGYLLEKNELQKAKVLTVSGRVSFEIIQKCHRARIPVLTAISSPSSLAVEMAEKANITLAAFCRKDRVTFYSGLERVSHMKELELV